ncbi:hypothetical protein [Cystobacter fuscus]|uniref:hypothetical protein n=1 Tax=Cystobacter fuscus TaxID=43 RepID=UPI002B297698|nr:hypothetical protein F0U63_42280 [Cystobacter fuscus]
MDGAPNARLSQIIDQVSLRGVGAGACSAITSEWLRAENEASEPSAAFNRILRNCGDQLIGIQAEERRLVSTARRLHEDQQALLTQQKTLHQDIAHTTEQLRRMDQQMAQNPGMRMMMQGSRASTERRLANLTADFNEGEHKLDQLEEDVQEAKNDVASFRGGGMERVYTSGGIRISPDPREFAKSVERQTSAEGFYRLELSNLQTGDGHVIGISHREDGSFKLMDPNTGEFVARDSRNLRRLLEGHVSEYGTRYTGFVVNQYE